MSPRGLRFSGALHAILLLLAIFGLPEILSPRPLPEPMSYSVDILPVSEISNIKPQEKTPEKPEPKKPEAEEKVQKKATPEAAKPPEPEPKPEPLPEPKPDPKKEPEKKPEEKKPEEKKPEPKEDPLKSILNSVKETAKSQEGKKPTEKKQQPANQKEARSDRPFNPDMQLSASLQDSIRSQMAQCWDVPAGAKDAHNLVITLRMQLNQDGSVITVELYQDQARYHSEPFFRAAADSAMRAVKRCSPLKNLPPDKYNGWSDMTMTFNPREMLF